MISLEAYAACVPLGTVKSPVSQVARRFDRAGVGLDLMCGRRMDPCGLKLPEPVRKPKKVSSRISDVRDMLSWQGVCYARISR